ncbi:hypothetical protein OAX78_02820 [Planctomycetota bacterium]|nr:hypothetical protein [Planctomycetota bacterium]
MKLTIKSTAALCLALVGALAQASHADQVHLNDGRVIQADSVEQSADQVHAHARYGTLSFDAADVVRVVVEQSAAATFDQRRARLAPSDVPSAIALARFGIEAGLTGRAAQVLIAAVEEQGPESRLTAEARRILTGELGYHRGASGWQDPETHYRELGYVKLRGCWVAPEVASWSRERTAARDTAAELRMSIRRGERSVVAAERDLGKRMRDHQRLERDVVEIQSSREIAEGELAAADDREGYAEHDALQVQWAKAWWAQRQQGAAQAPLPLRQEGAQRHQRLRRARSDSDSARAEANALLREENRAPLNLRDSEQRLTDAVNELRAATDTLADCQERLARTSERLAELDRLIRAARQASR